MLIFSMVIVDPSYGRSLLILWGLVSLNFTGNLQIDLTLLFFAYFVFPALLAYFLSCVILFLYGLMTKKKDLSSNDLS